MLRLLSTLLLLISGDLSASRSTVGTRLHVERSFTIMLSAPPVVALQAFGPFFTLQRHSTQVWLLQTWDVRHYVVHYVAVDPGAKATDILIHLVPWGAHKSRATISYTWTSLTSAGDAEVAHVAKYFVSEAPHWESTINDYLARHISP